MSELILHCPKCPREKSPKLYINIDKGLFNCFRCNFSGSLKKLYAFPDIISKIEDVVSLSESSKLKHFKPLEHKSYDIFEDLNPVREVLYTDPQYSYLQSRGWTEDMIFTYKPLVSSNVKYSDRVILPVFDSSGSIVYFTARSIDPDAFLRYKNPSVPKSNVLFYSDVSESALFADIGIITEGIFDAAKIPNAVALLGKVLTSQNESNIISFLKKKSSIYVCLDSNTSHNTEKICASLRSWFPHKSIFTINEEAYGEKDLGNLSESLSSIELVSWIKQNSSKYTGYSLSSKLKHRFTCITAHN